MPYKNPPKPASLAGKPVARDRLTEIIKEARPDIKLGTDTRIATDKERIADILKISPETQSVARPLHEIQQKWQQEDYIKRNTPWYVKTMSVGPVGGFLNMIQKPLAFTSSAIKEGIDLFTGQDASWGDFKKQYNDNYTFGNILRDYNVMQDRNSGWQKFGAAALGFIGDVALDPLSYLGLVGKGIAFSNQLVKGGARKAAREMVRKNVLRQVQARGDDVFGSVARQMADGDWLALADDIADTTAKGKKTLTKVDDGFEWTTRTGRVNDKGEEIFETVKFTFDEVADIERMYDIGAGVIKDGATSIKPDDLRWAAGKYADSGLDRFGRYGADDFLDDAGEGFRQAEQGFRNAWLTAEDAAKMNIGFGLKVPGTGPIGRALRIADPIERAVNKVTKLGLQAPIGVRFMTSETPVIGRLVTGIPQGLRNGIIKQATGLKNPKLRRGGLTKLVTRGKFSGKLGELKSTLRTTDDAVLVHQGKRLIYANASGNAKGKMTKPALARTAGTYVDAIYDGAKTNKVDVGVLKKELFSALGGNDEAATRVVQMTGDDSLLVWGRQVFEDLRDEAITAGGRDFLGYVDNFVPRIVSEDFKKAMQSRLRKTGKYMDGKAYQTGAHTPQGPEYTRKYVNEKEFADAVAKRAKADGIELAEAEDLLRADKNAITDEFFGERLFEPASPKDDGGTWGSVEDQIADIIERGDANYMLFTDDIEMALKGYVDHISNRVGEVWTEKLLLDDGVLIDRMAEYVFLPNEAAVKAGKEFRQASENFSRAQGELIQALRRKQGGVGDAVINQKNIDELQDVAEQAKGRLDEANARQERLAEEAAELEEVVLANKANKTDLDRRIRDLERQINEAEVDSRDILKMAEEREKLLEMKNALISDGSTLKWAYDTVASGTAQVLYMERAVSAAFGSGEDFEKFISLFGHGFDYRNINAPDGQLARKLGALGNKVDDRIAESVRMVNGKYHFVKADGTTKDIEALFADIDGILQNGDQNGIGVWLGVEREIDFLNMDAKRSFELGPDTPEGQEIIFDGFDVGNPAVKLSDSLDRIRSEVDEANEAISEYVSLVGDNVAATPATSGNVLEAEEWIVNEIQAVYDLVAAQGFDPFAESFKDLLNSPAMQQRLQTFYAAKSMPQSAYVFDGQAIDDLVEQIDNTMMEQITDLDTRIDVAESLAEQQGVPLRLHYMDSNGEVAYMGVRDYVHMKKVRDVMRSSPTTSQLPIDPVRPSVDDIMSGAQFEGQLGSNVGGGFEYDGVRYYVKQYGDETADGKFVADGNGRDRITGEVLANSLYRELGIQAPDGYASRSADGSLYHVAPWIDDIQTVAASGIDPLEASIVTMPDGTFQLMRTDEVTNAIQQYGMSLPEQTLAEAMAEGLAADILLANWDAVGTGFDNIGVSATRGLVRVDNGSSFFHRAMGDLKLDLGWDYLDVSDLDSMLDESMNAWYAPLANAGIPDGDLTKLLGKQVTELLNLRLKMGGMESFVARHMPGLAPNEIGPYANFLEKRLEVLANRFGVSFPELDSDDFAKAYLRSRKISEDAIETASKEGSIMRLFHKAGQPELGVGDRYGAAATGWGDFEFLNATPNGMYYGTGSGDAFNLVLETPLGGRNIKVYGVRPDQEIQAAELAMRMNHTRSPQEIEELLTELSSLELSNYQNYAGLHIRLDQLSRVADSDPEFLDAFVRHLKKEYKGNRYLNESIATIEIARDMGRLRAPKNLYEWNANIPRAQMLNKLASAPFEERLQFAIWLQHADGGGKSFDLYTMEQVRRRASGKGNKLQLKNQNEWGADIVYAGTDNPADKEIADFINNALKGDDPDLPSLGLGKELSDMPEMFARYLAMKDRDLMPQVWAQNIAKYNTMLHKWVQPIDNALADMRGTYGLDEMKLVDIPTPVKEGDISVKGQEWDAEILNNYRWTKGFYERYRRSLTADGYNGAMWINDMEHIHTDTSYIDGFPNMMLTNPLAVHSGDVAMTHRNISSLLDPTKKGDTIPLDATPDMGIDDLPTFVGEAREQAFSGQTQLRDTAAFMDWWEMQSETLAAPRNVMDDTEKVIKQDLLEDLVAERAALVNDVQAAQSQLADVLTRWDVAKGIRKSLQEDISAGDFALDQANIEEWIATQAMVKTNAQVDEALAVLGRMGAPANVPLENLPDDLIAVRQAVGALIQNDSEMLALALDGFEQGADDWIDLVSPLVESVDDIHKIGKREEVLDTVFRSGFKPIGADLQGPAQIVEAMKAAETYVARGGAGTFFRRYDKLHNLLRAYMIAKPGFHGRNFMSAVFMNHLAGMNWSSYRKFMRAYWKHQEEEMTRLGLTKQAEKARKSMVKRGINPDKVNPEHVEYVRMLAENGALGSAHGQVANEFVMQSQGRGRATRFKEKIMPFSIKIRGKNVNLLDAVNPFSTRNQFLQLSRDVGMATETFVRGSLGFDTLLKGDTAESAFNNIMKFHFDYDDLSDFERNVVKRVVPFYTWTRKNMPLMMEMFARRPEVFNRYMSLKKEVEATTEGPPAIYPRWMQRQGAIQLPFKFEGEDMFILPDMPFKTPLELLDPTLSFDKDLSPMERIRIAIGSVGTQITPIVKAPYEWHSKENLWKGYSYDGSAEVVPRAYSMIPGLMPLLELAGAARKNNQGEWAMPDYALHSMAQLLPTFTDFRRLFPDEKKYQERTLSTWMSFVFGLGLRTNTKYEQQMELISRQYEMRDEIAEERNFDRARKR